MVETAVRTHCPTCGARLARPELSICAYCATPLGLAPAAREPTGTMLRLGRMAQHEKYPEAMASEPAREIEDLEATALGSRGLSAVGVGVFLLLLALPWTLMDTAVQRAIVDEVTAALAPGAAFTTITTATAVPWPAARRFRALLNSVFSDVQTSRMVWRNVPPAFVYICRNPR